MYRDILYKFALILYHNRSTCPSLGTVSSHGSRYSSRECLPLKEVDVSQKITIMADEDGWLGFSIRGYGFIFDILNQIDRQSVSQETYHVASKQSILQNTCQCVLDFDGKKKKIVESFLCVTFPSSKFDLFTSHMSPCMMNT